MHTSPLPALGVRSFFARKGLLVGVAGCVYAVLVLAAFQMYAKTDSHLFEFLAFGVALAPAAVYAGLRVPLIFPLCLYILVLPFDTIGGIGGGSSLAKLLGVLSAAAVLVNVVRRGNSVRPSVAVLPWLALLAYMTVSVFWALDFDSARVNLQMYASLIALYALLSFVRIDRGQLNIILGTVLLAGVISGGYDAYLYHSGTDVLASGGGSSRVILEFNDSIIDPNTLAAALVLPFLVGLYWMFNARRVAARALMVPATGAILFGLIATGSRGGFMQLAAACTYLLAMSRRRLQIGAIVAVATVAVLAVEPQLVLRFQAAANDGAAGRGDIWKVGIHAFQRHWLIGAGVGNFPSAFDESFLNVFIRHVVGWHFAAHNTPLQLATELGILGLAIFLVAVGVQFGALRGYFGSSGPDLELRRSLEAACIAAVVAGFSISCLNEKFVWLAFSLMLLLRNYAVCSESPGLNSGTRAHEAT